MPRKKKDEAEEAIAETIEATESTDADTAVEAAAGDVAETVEEAPAEAAGEESAPVEEPAIEAAADEVAADAAPVAEEKAKKPKAAPKAAKAEKTATAPVSTDKKVGGKRAEKVGIVSSDKMTKTVVVRVDRLVKHPIYRKYVKKRKKFMAHDDLGAKIGDKVKIVETRPLSARKRWRVVEIIQKAQL